ncbi:hypothetical protein GC175_32615 [bacterium]|nr:hypothetical protein [bacterium]
MPIHATHSNRSHLNRLLGIALSLILGLSLLPNRPLHAQPPDEALGEAAIFLTLFPQLRALPAPPVIQPGLRVSYQGASAIIGGGGAGGGPIQYDVVAMDGVQTLVYTTSYLGISGGHLIPNPPTALVGLPALGEFWIHPSVLVNAESVANQSLSVTRYNKNVNGVIITVVRFQSQSSGGQVVWEFSTNSGLLVFYSRSTFIPGTGQTSETQSTFLGFRTLPLPWNTNTLAPNWARANAEMIYTGTQSTTVAGAGTLTSNVVATVQVNTATPTWSSFLVDAFIQNIGSSSSAAVTGIGQIFGGYWLPRSALGVNVSSPVLLDQDPITGIQVTLARAQNGNIILTQIGSALEHIAVYDAVLGSLNFSQQTIARGNSIQQTVLTRTGGSDLGALDSLPEVTTPTPTSTSQPTATPTATPSPTPTGSSSPGPSPTTTSTPASGSSPTPEPGHHRIYLPTLRQ